MDSAHVNRLIDAIDRHRRVEDPALVRRVEQRHRREAAQAIAVFALLALSAATNSLPERLRKLFGVDEDHRHLMPARVATPRWVSMVSLCSIPRGVADRG